MIDFADMTWTCMVCKDERPDAAISVAHRPLAGLENAFPGTRLNLRYCNDRPACIAEALEPGPWPKKEPT